MHTLRYIQTMLFIAATGVLLTSCAAPSAKTTLTQTQQNMLTKIGDDYLRARHDFLQHADEDEVKQLAAASNIGGVIGRIIMLIRDNPDSYQAMSLTNAQSITNGARTVSGRSLWPALPDDTPPDQASLFFAEILLKDNAAAPSTPSALVVTLSPPQPDTLTVKISAAKNLVLFPTEDARIALLHALQAESHPRLTWEITMCLTQLATPELRDQLRTKIEQTTDPDTVVRYRRALKMVERQLQTEAS